MEVAGVRVRWGSSDRRQPLWAGAARGWAGQGRGGGRALCGGTHVPTNTFHPACRLHQELTELAADAERLTAAAAAAEAATTAMAGTGGHRGRGGGRMAGGGGGGGLSPRELLAAEASLQRRSEDLALQLAALMEPGARQRLKVGVRGRACTSMWERARQWLKEWTCVVQRIDAGGRQRGRCAHGPGFVWARVAGLRSCGDVGLQDPGICGVEEEATALRGRA